MKIGLVKMVPLSLSLFEESMDHRRIGSHSSRHSDLDSILLDFVGFVSSPQLLRARQITPSPLGGSLQPHSIYNSVHQGAPSHLPESVTKHWMSLFLTNVWNLPLHVFVVSTTQFSDSTFPIILLPHLFINLIIELSNPMLPEACYGKMNKLEDKSHHFESQPIWR